MKGKNFLFAFYILALGVACDHDHPAPTGVDIYGYWRYESGLIVEGGDAEPGLNPVAHIQLDEDGTLSGFTSRNIIGGTFEYDSLGSIDLDIQMMTRVADTPWSGRFTQVLEEVDRYRLEENRLTLINPETMEEYTFLRMSPDACRPVINDERVYREISSDEFQLIDANVVGPCLEVLIGYGGGCEDDIGVALIGSGAYAESLPPQLAIKIVVDDDDPCEAFIRRTYYFDLTDFQYEGLDELILRLEGFDEQLLVRY